MLTISDQQEHWPTKLHAQLLSRCHMKKKKKRQKSRIVKADEVLTFGPLRVSRFGNRILWQNKMTEAQHAEMIDTLSASLEQVISDIDEKVATLVERIRLNNPLSLLRCAYSMFAMAALTKRSEPEWSTEDNVTVWILEYIFSLVAATKAEHLGDVQISEEDFAKITQEMKALVKAVMLDFTIASTARRRVQEVVHDDQYEMLYTQCVMHWCCVRKSRYALHDVPFLKAFLAPQDATLSEAFGIGAAGLVSAIEAIAEAHARGMVNAVETMHNIHREFFDRLGERQFSTPEEMHALMDEFGLAEPMNAAAGRFFGDDLFDVQKQADLPIPLLDELSWEPGGDREFLAEGLYSGWPLRLPSIKKRPFLKMGGRYYCHISYGLVDNVYRVLEKAVRRLKPALATAWKERQQEASETLPIDLFQKLLPGSQAIRSVHYQWPSTVAKDKNWCETDIVLTYDDHLVIGEVKAGAFTYTSPATDFPAYLESVKTLVQKPAVQALRFMEYLGSQDEVPLYQIDEGGERVEVARIRKSNWRQITLCGFTLDNFTHLASQAHGLKSLGVDFKDFPFWSLAIDDLMVLADIFPSPTIFAHYLEQRQSAIRTPRFTLYDEIDHIGMYIKYNHYSTKVDELGDAEGVWHGYSEDIDRYYHGRLVGEQVEPPSQSIPAIFKRIIELLDQSGKPGRCRVASILLDFGDIGREEVQQSIITMMVDQRIKGRPRPLLVGAEPCDMTFCCSSSAEGIALDVEQALRHARKSLLIARKNEHLLIFLEFGNKDLPHSIDWHFISLNEVPEAELEELKREAAALQEKRVETEMSRRERRRIGPNEQCPCGSRLKYKRCCSRRI